MSLELKQAALSLLARREHSRMELKRKLQARFDDVEAINAALDELAEQNYQSDLRYAESMLRHRSGQGYGLNYIQQQLRQAGVGQELLAQALAAVDIDWLEAGRRLYARKYKKPALDFKERMKRARYLYAHGFDKELIDVVLQEAP